MRGVRLNDAFGAIHASDSHRQAELRGPSQRAAAAGRAAVCWSRRTPATATIRKGQLHWTARPSDCDSHPRLQDRARESPWNLAPRSCALIEDGHSAVRLKLDSVASPGARGIGNAQKQSNI